MKILIVADEESKALYDYYDSSRLKDIDLILSCGDLRASYLEFLVTMGRAPVLYVMGNQDDSIRRIRRRAASAWRNGFTIIRAFESQAWEAACGTSRMEFTCTQRRNSEGASRS